MATSGKDFSFSATTNYRGSDVLYVFSTNAHPFEHETSYSKFAAYALLNHGGDDKAVAQAIADGLGMKDERRLDQSSPATLDEERKAIQSAGSAPDSAAHTDQVEDESYIEFAPQFLSD